jgi:hypothetical protein
VQYVGSGSLNSANYQGTGIKVNSLAVDGVTVVDSQLRSNLSVVPLSGAVAAAPSDLAQWFNALYYNPSLLSASAVWGTGAEYLKYTSTELADTYTVEDFTGSTTGNTPTPVGTGTTIAALMAAGGIASSEDGTTYTLTNGSVVSVGGVTTYVASVVRPDLTTPAYRTYYELYGNVYTGSLVKAGTVLGGNVYSCRGARYAHRLYSQLLAAISDPFERRGCRQLAHSLDVLTDGFRVAGLPL